MVNSFSNYFGIILSVELQFIMLFFQFFCSDIVPVTGSVFFGNIEPTRGYVHLKLVSFSRGTFQQIRAIH